MSVKQEALLRDWQFYGETVTGRVYGHPRFKDGTRIHTSRIVNFKNGVVETLHTYYRLEGYYEQQQKTN